MMSKWSGLVLLVCWAMTCKTDEPTISLPPNEELINMIVDLHVAEGTIARVPFGQRDSIGKVVRDRVAMTYHLTGDELEEIVGLLQLDQELNRTIYDSVVVRLGRLTPPPGAR